MPSDAVANRSRPQTPGAVSVTAADIDALIDADRLETLYQRTPHGLVGGAVFSLLLGWAFLPSAGGHAALVWVAVKLLTQAGRALDWWHFTQSAHRRAQVSHWHRRHATGSLIDGLGWGGAAVLFLPSGNPLLDGVLIAGLVGVASIGVFTLTSHLGDAARFMLATLLPMMLHYLQLQIWPTSWVIVIGCSIYFGVLWVEAQRAQAHTQELLRLRFENAAIAEERERAWHAAQESSLAKSRFLATVSHELRTPLNGIMGMTQLMEREGAAPGQAERLGVVRQSASHLLSLIDDLLDISRIEFGRMRLQRQVVALAPMVHEVVDLLRPVAQAKGLALLCALDPDLPAAVETDPARVRQVLHNLLGNALKFTEQGQVRLALARRGKLLQFTVTDTGKGIAPALLERIFDAFEQGPEARQSGTGLGLTISRHLARALGGNLTVQSPPGSGAVFQFTLACQAAHLPPDNAAKPAALANGALQGEVLVVEDNAVNALVTTGMLAKLGLRSRVAEDGAQALAELARAPVDLVLLDCQMPVLDGWETARQWRQREAEGLAPPGRLPIVALTANAVAGDRELCLAAGMDDYLSKPFTLDDLGAVLQRHLGPAETAGGLRTPP
jgi:signal transduction histidine kinase/CheY-like chemotaxis protein